MVCISPSLIVIASDRVERSNLTDPVDCEKASSLRLRLGRAARLEPFGFELMAERLADMSRQGLAMT